MKRNLAFSIVDQAVVSIFNFALNLAFIRLWSPEDFGLFAIIAAISLFTTMVQNAVINTPLAVHLPLAASTREKAVLRRVFSAANLLLTLLVLILSLIGLTGWLGASGMELAASFYMGTQLLREYYRGLLAVEGKLRTLLATDAVHVLLAAGVLSGLHWFGATQWQTVSVCLLVLGCSGFLTIAPLLVPGRWPELGSSPGEMVAVFAPQAHEIRWSLLGAVTTDIQNRGYVFVAAAVFGPATVAHLQAGRIFFGPLGLLTGAWSRVARPQLAKLMGQGNALRFDAVLQKALWSFIAFNILFMASLWMAWPYLSSLVFGSKYRDLGLLVAGWGMASLAFQIRACLSVGVQALRRFRELTMATILGALLAVAFVVLACALDQSTWLMASVIGGECMAIVVVIRILRQPVLAMATGQSECIAPRLQGEQP